MLSRRSTVFRAAVAVALLFAASCSDDGASTATTTARADTSSETMVVAPDNTGAPDMAAATFTTQPGTEQVAVLGGEPGAALTVRTPAGELTATGTVDEQGSQIGRAHV